MSFRTSSRVNGAKVKDFESVYFPLTFVLMFRHLML
jgi:hypothetical protein